MKGLQTPKKDRRSKSVHELISKPQKITTKKCSDRPILTPSEDDMAVEDSIELSQLSAIAEDHLLDHSPESDIILDPLPPFPSRESFDSTDLSPSSITTVTKNVLSDSSPSDTTSNVDVMTAKVVASLKQAQTQVMNATETVHLSLEFVDKLIDMMAADFLGPIYESKRVEKLLYVKFRTLLLAFLPVFLCVVLYFWHGEQSSYSGSPPT